MNTRFSKFAPACAVLAVLSSPIAWAQTKAPVVPGNETRTPINLTAERNALSDARTLAKANNTAAAEQALVALNRGKAGTSGYHRESASRLLQLAGDLSREAALTPSRTFIARAQEHLAEAIRLARKPEELAFAHMTLGSLHERYRGDLTAAIASYQAALQAMPKSAAAQEAVQRLQLTVKGQENRGQPATKR